MIYQWWKCEYKRTSGIYTMFLFLQCYKAKVSLSPAFSLYSLNPWTILWMPCNWLKVKDLMLPKLKDGKQLLYLYKKRCKNPTFNNNLRVSSSTSAKYTNYCIFHWHAANTWTNTKLDGLHNMHQFISYSVHHHTAHHCAIQRHNFDNPNFSHSMTNSQRAPQSSSDQNPWSNYYTFRWKFTATQCHDRRIECISTPHQEWIPLHCPIRTEWWESHIQDE